MLVRYTVYHAYLQSLTMMEETFVDVSWYGFGVWEKALHSCFVFSSYHQCCGAGAAPKGRLLFRLLLLLVM